jgi:hypothetical protein
MEIIETGFLNFRVNLDYVKRVLEIHPIKNEILKFVPHKMDKKYFMKSFLKFLKYKDTLDLSLYGFEKTIVTSDNFGTKVFYKAKFENFFWSEIFEAVHLKLV